MCVDSDDPWYWVVAANDRPHKEGQGRLGDRERYARDKHIPRPTFLFES